MNLTSTPKRGYDSWVNIAAPNLPHGSGNWMQLQSAAKRGYLWLPMPARMAGRTIASAILTGHAHGATDAQNLTFTAAVAKWQASLVTWNNQPGTTGSALVVAVPALADGDEFTADLTTLVQPIADGTVKNYGWRITTNSANVEKFAQFDSGVDTAWTLTIEFSEDPEAPTALAPNGTVVSVAKPVVTFDFTEYGATATDLASIRVEVDLTGDGIADWDSGWLTAVDPSLDLAAAGMTGVIAAGDSPQWRAYVQDDAGRQSLPSDWAVYTYQPDATLTLDSPAAGVLYDPTSDVLAHISTTHLAAYRIRVTDGTDRTSVRYDSGKVKATDPSNIALALPLKNDENTRIFKDDETYQINVRAFDDYDREATPGTKTYVELWTTVAFDDDGALATVSTFTATQVGATPFVQLDWTDSAAPDAYTITRDGVHIARLDPADVVVGASTYQWQDNGAAPAVSHTYKIHRITVGVGRSPALSDTMQIDPEGIWLLRDNGGYVVLDDTGVDQLATLERRLRYNPINRQHAVDIVTQYEGISGPVTSSIEDAEDQTVAQAKAVLDAIKKHPTEEVQLIYATVSKPVLVSNLSVLPDPEYRADQNRHKVTFYVDQSGDFDYRLG